LGLASFPCVSLQQYPGLQQSFGWAFSFIDQRLKLDALRLAQLDHVSFKRNVLGGHDRKSRSGFLYLAAVNPICVLPWMLFISPSQMAAHDPGIQIK
jgi:hypothetical protein